jgi:hypothetical protein
LLLVFLIVRQKLIEDSEGRLDLKVPKDFVSEQHRQPALLRKPVQGRVKPAETIGGKGEVVGSRLIPHHDIAVMGLLALRGKGDRCGGGGWFRVLAFGLAHGLDLSCLLANPSDISSPWIKPKYFSCT